jgi:selenide,water dikinase
LLVGYDTADDAAVYRLSDEIAMISTADFITPPVDDPYWFGQIAAANAISDIYSMGGRPLTALNLVMFPSKQLDVGLLRDILEGGSDKVREAGASLAGGHTVEDEEPKYGLAVNGIVHPDQVVTNTGARPGDALILTKPIGSGVLFNALRDGKIAYRELELNVLPEVATLNRVAIEAALAHDLHACTDVTGFGITGHLLEMVIGSGVAARLDHGSLPIYPDAIEMYSRGVTTGSNKLIREMTAGHLQLRGSFSSSQEELLFDPQTSGGLLLAVPDAEADALLADLVNAGVAHAARVGEIIDGKPGIEVV